MTLGRPILAGNEIKIVGTVALEVGDPASLDYLILVVDATSNEVLGTVVPTATVDPDDATRATITGYWTIPDSMTERSIVLRLDGDKSDGGDKIAAQATIRVQPAAAQRPA